MASPTTGTQAPGGNGPTPFPPFQAETFATQLFWLALAFVLLYVLMAKVALPRVTSILQTRRGIIDSSLQEAQKHREDSEAAMVAYEKSLADARNRAQAIAHETREKFVAESDTARKALEAKLGEQLAAAEGTIVSTKAAAMTNVRGVAVDAASAIVERLIGKAPAPSTVVQAVDRVLKS